MKKDISRHSYFIRKLVIENSLTLSNFLAGQLNTKRTAVYPSEPFI